MDLSNGSPVSEGALISTLLDANQILSKDNEEEVRNEHLIMTSNDRQNNCPESHPQNSDSFSERICDDLCEVILQYLSLEDKLSFECVSKQFQRTVFQRQYELRFDPLIKDFNKTIDELFKDNGFDLISFESLLKKCPNITSIEFSNSYNFDNYNEFIALIVKYCNHLNEFKSPSVAISDSALEAFHNKFGSKLKVFKPQKDLILNFPNLEKLYIYQSSYEQLQLISKLKLQKLKKLSATVEEVDQQFLIQELFDSFPSLQYLDLTFFRSNFHIVLKNISNLKDLVDLKIKRSNGYIYGCDLSHQIFSESVKEIAKNCRKIKSFQSSVTLNSEEGITLRQSLSPLKEFKQLKRLRLVLRFKGNKEFSMNAFEGLSNLTHLTLAFYLPFKLKPFNNFTNIDIHLPNLQYLEFINICGEQESSQIADFLSPLSKLKIIKIVYHSGYFSPQFEEEITRKCPQIKNIGIKFEKNYSSMVRLMCNLPSV